MSWTEHSKIPLRCYREHKAALYWAVQLLVTTCIRRMLGMVLEGLSASQRGGLMLIATLARNGV